MQPVTGISWIAMMNGNPLRWTFTYQMIFVLLLLAGAAIGVTAGYVAETIDTMGPGPVSLWAWIGDYPSAAGLWALVGATPIGAIAYVIRITAEDG
jgi:hypothetical protein